MLSRATTYARVRFLFVFSSLLFLIRSRVLKKKTIFSVRTDILLYLVRVSTLSLFPCLCCSALNFAFFYCSVKLENDSYLVLFLKQLRVYSRGVAQLGRAVRSQNMPAEPSEKWDFYYMPTRIASEFFFLEHGGGALNMCKPPV